MIVKFKKLHPNAVIPTKAHSTDAGADLVAIERTWDDEFDVWNYKTGLAIEIPKNHIGLIFPRSSIYKKEQALTNCVGVIDFGFQGEICFKFRDTEKNGNCLYEVGERVGQIVIMPYPEVEFEEVQELSDSERGTKGWGSSGK